METLCWWVGTRRCADRSLYVKIDLGTRSPRKINLFKLYTRFHDGVVRSEDCGFLADD